jgi:hypothetical protein
LLSHFKVGTALVALVLLVVLLGMTSPHEERPEPNKQIVDLLRGTPTFYDNFARSDRPIEGDMTPYGQIYRTNVRGGQFIRNKHYVSNTAGAPKIAYITMNNEPHGIAAGFVFTPYLAIRGIQEKPNNLPNAVIGAAAKAFGFGSVQLAVYPDQWKLFVVQKPIVDPYPVLASGYFKDHLQYNKRYSMAMTYNPATSSVTVSVPGSAPQTIRNPIFSRYWGRVIGMQIRRQSNALGNVLFTILAAR